MLNLHVASPTFAYHQKSRRRSAYLPKKPTRALSTKMNAPTTKRLSTLPISFRSLKPNNMASSDEANNLALACHRCNLQKESNVTGIDPDTRSIVSFITDVTNG